MEKIKCVHATGNKLVFYFGLTFFRGWGEDSLLFQMEPQLQNVSYNFQKRKMRRLWFLSQINKQCYDGPVLIDIMFWCVKQQRCLIGVCALKNILSIYMYCVHVLCIMPPKKGFVLLNVHSLLNHTVVICQKSPFEQN